MADYKTKRIGNLKAYITETYKELPEECGKMSMDKFSDFLDARTERLISEYQKPVDFKRKEKIDYEELSKKTLKYFDFSGILKCIDTLVDMGELNFDESMPLKGIVKIIKAKKIVG